MGFTVYWSTHSHGEQDEAEKCSHDMDWLQKSQWYDPTQLANKLSENVIHIWQCY